MKRASDLLDVNGALRPMLSEQANERLLSFQAATGAPKTMPEIYIDLPIAERSQHEAAQATPIEFLGLDNVLSSGKPVIIFGGRESGKTTYAYHIALHVSNINTNPISAPILLDLALLRPGSNVLLRETKRTLGFAQLQGMAEDLLQAGRFVFILDSFSTADRRKASMISEFIAKYPKNIFVLLADESPLPLKTSRIEGSRV